MAKAHAISIIANCDNVKHCQSSFLAISSFSSISIFYDVDSLTIKFIWKAHYTCTDVVTVADPGGPRGPHRFHVSRTPPYPAAGSATE